ncbi:MAG: 5-bromo-4-chloroindolyl phosphate hydrolysis family protein [Butyrivibrio sp.]|nr:5-bromo-4-chloroindolyl phosphate hydrolysis family protein [Butyrivibrio sp.]
MNFDELYETGNDILNKVNRAVETGNYSDLGDTIRALVADAIRENGTQPRSTGGARNTSSGRKDYSFSSQPGTAGKAAVFGQTGADVRDTSSPRVASYGQSTHYASGLTKTPFLRNPVSSVGGIVKLVGGIIGTAFFGSITVTMLISSIILFAADGVAFGIAGLIGTGIFGVLLGLCIWMIKSGSREKNLVNRFQQYGRTLGRATFFSIEDLARRTGQSYADLLDDIKEMMRRGFLPQARMDAQETTVMLTDEAYQQYLDAERERQRREQESSRAAMEAAANAAPQPATAQAGEAAKSPYPPEVQSVLDDGQNYIRIIREINDEIPDTVDMSNQLYRLEDTMRRIFAQVEKDPTCAGELRKFMNYYLPTTEKLLRAYVDLYRQPEVGENINQTRREIEDALTTINEAFERLLDSLFQDMAWDISSDISAMKTMMAQDGLTTEGRIPQAPEPPKQVMRSDGTIELIP